MGSIRNRMAGYGMVAGLLLAGLLLTIISCEGLREKYVRQDKLFRIAYLEDTRRADTLLTGEFLLSDPDPEIRAKTAMAIGRIGGTYYLETLKAHLQDSSSLAAGAKYFAAGLIGDSSFFEPLYNLAHSDTIARDAAIEALGRLAAGEQAVRLAEFLTDRDTLVVYQAMLALWRADEWSLAEKMAGIGGTTGSRKVKYGALYALARGGRREGHGLFLTVLSDPEPEFRMLGYGGLGRSLDSATIKQIAGGLNDAEPRVVVSAMNALRRFGAWGAVYVTQKLPDYMDEKLLVAGLDIVGEFPAHKNASRIVERILRDDRRENVRAAAAATILHIDGVKALMTIDEVLQTPTAYQKLRLAEALGDIEREAALARLTPLFNDPSPQVRVAALQSLCRIDSLSARRYIQPALSDSDFVVVAVAIDLAARFNMVEQVANIADIFLSNRGSIDSDLKRSIIDAFKIFERHPANDSLMVAVLEEAANDEWFLIRSEATDVLKDKFGIDQKWRVGEARSFIEKTNFAELFSRYEVNPVAGIETPRGTITIELLYNEAPKTVNNFISLADKKFYDSRIFHRVVPNFVIQDGCPRGDGWGNPGYAIRCEYNRLSYTTGMVGMALSGKDTGGSQYFITLSPQPHLDAHYTIFGRVISGMDVAGQIVRGDSIRNVTILHDRGGS